MLQRKPLNIFFVKFHVQLKFAKKRQERSYLYSVAFKQSFKMVPLTFNFELWCKPLTLLRNLYSKSCCWPPILVKKGSKSPEIVWYKKFLVTSTYFYNQQSYERKNWIFFLVLCQKDLLTKIGFLFEIHIQLYTFFCFS